MVDRQRYRAFLVPGLKDLDRDEGLRLGFEWLRNSGFEGRPRIVLHAVRMINSARLLGLAAQEFEIVSPRSRDVSRLVRGPVLAVWPGEQTLAFAEDLAFGSALCVIPGSLDDLRPWVVANQPTVLGVQPHHVPALDLPAAVEETLRLIDDFDGHNDFVGAGGKRFALERLRTLHESGQLDPGSAYTWLRAHGECTYEGAARIRQWAEEILAGKKHRLG